MIIYYKKKIVNAKLYAGLVFLFGLFIPYLFYDFNWRSSFFWILMGLFYLIIFLYQKKFQYLTIENGVIKQNWPFGKKMKLNEIKSIQHLDGQFTLNTKTKQLNITISQIDETSLSFLKKELNETEAIWN